MTEKRFTDDGIEEIENQSFTDNLTGKTYWIDNGLDEIVELLNELYEENTMLKEHRNINCRNCQYFVSDSTSSDCLKREDIGYKGTCIDGMDLHKLAKNCPYY